MSLSVVDTTVLSNFATLRRLQLVQEAFPDVAAPRAVLDELAEGRRLGHFPSLEWTWLREIQLQPEELQAFEGLRAGLGHGEAACLAVAQVRRALLLTDDQAARRRAKAFGVELSGSVGVLSRLVDAGVLTLEEANGMLHRLIEAGYWSPVSSLQELDD